MRRRSPCLAGICRLSGGRRTAEAGRKLLLRFLRSRHPWQSDACANSEADRTGTAGATCNPAPVSAVERAHRYPRASAQIFRFEIDVASPIHYPFALSRGHSSAGRALQWHCRGRRFDPDWLHQDLPSWQSLPASPSSRGLGHRPFTAVTGVRIPLGTPI